MFLNLQIRIFENGSFVQTPMFQVPYSWPYFSRDMSILQGTRVHHVALDMSFVSRVSIGSFLYIDESLSNIYIPNFPMWRNLRI